MRLARVHGLQTAGNAAIAVALANSLFFTNDPNAARSSIILYLVLSIAPFSVVAPMIGPAIDRFRGGRKLVITVLMFGLSLASFGMIGRTQSLLIFPLAFAVLVFSKGYAVAKAAIVPLTVKSNEELVQKNSRLTVLTGVMSIVGSLPALLVSWLGGSSWAVALAMLIFLWAAILSFKLPSAQTHTSNQLADLGEEILSSRMWTGKQPAPQPQGPSSPNGPFDQDSALMQTSDLETDEEPASEIPASEILASDAEATPAQSRFSRISNVWRMGVSVESLNLSSVRSASVAMMVVRGCTGFMTFFLAFHFRGGTDDVDLSGIGTAVGAGIRDVIGFDVDSQGTEPVWKLGLLIVFAIAGGLLGSFLAPKLKQSRTPERIISICLLLSGIASIVALLLGGLVGGMLLAFFVGFGGGAGRVAFDSIVQRDAADSDYGRSFALFEARFQLVWVLGALLPVIFLMPFLAGCLLIAIFYFAELGVFMALTRKARQQKGMPAEIQ